MFNWQRFGYWMPSRLNEELLTLTFEQVETLYEQGNHMCDFNHARIPLIKILELRVLHERYDSNFSSSCDSLATTQNLWPQKR